MIWDASNPHDDISPGQISRTSLHPQSNRSQPQICAIFPKNGTKNERRTRSRLSSALPKPSTQRFRGRAHDASRVVRTAPPSQHPQVSTSRPAAPGQQLQVARAKEVEYPSKLGRLTRNVRTVNKKQPRTIDKEALGQSIGNDRIQSISEDTQPISGNTPIPLGPLNQKGNPIGKRQGLP